VKIIIYAAEAISSVFKSLNKGLVMNDVSNLLATIQSSTRLSAVVVVAEGCHIADGKLYTIMVEISHQEQLLLDVFKLCYPTVENMFPRPLTQAVYFFSPTAQTPLFVRTQYAPELYLKNDVRIASEMMRGATYDEAAHSPELATNIQHITAMLGTESTDKFPSLFQRTRNFAKEMWVATKESLHGRPMLISADDAYARLRVCETCPFLQNNKCSKCGCFMNLKVHVKSSSCPEGKW
jgi:hypothetical protein